MTRFRTAAEAVALGLEEIQRVLLALSGVASMVRRVGDPGAVPTGFSGVVFGLVNHSLGSFAGVLVGVGLLLRRRSVSGDRKKASWPAKAGSAASF